MPKNRESEKPLVSESESDEDDDEVSSEEVGSSGSDSEPEQTPTESTKNPPTAPGPKKPQPQPVLKPPNPSSSSDEEDEESGSEPESDTDPVNSNLKPLISKPMDEPQKPTTSAAARKPRSKPYVSKPSTLLKSAGAKRPAEEEKEAEAKDNKRLKKKPLAEAETSGKTPSTSNDDSKKQLFQRLWSEDDEIVVLKGMIDYALEKKSDPVADLNYFHDFIRKNLHVDATRTPLQDKIRRLKKKYENNKSKEEEGKERTLKAHEQKSYDLSKKIWGSENDNGSVLEKAVGSPKANGTTARKIPDKGFNKVENSNFHEVKSLDVANADVEMTVRSFSAGSNNGMSMREWILRAGAKFFEGEKKIEGHKEWRKLRVEEIELEEKKYDVMRAQTKLVLNVMRATDH